MGRPNILMIIADQLRYDCIGYSRDYPVMTPNIDRLASEGMWFERAFTPVPVCCPARQALLTGLRPERFGVLCNFDFMASRALEPTQWTWTRELNGLGYSQGHVGKWSINPIHDATAYGFGEHVGTGGYSAFRAARNCPVAPAAGWEGGTDAAPADCSRTHWLAEQAIDMLGRFQTEGKPWHISLNFPEPHLPCCPAEEFARLYGPADVPMWRSFGDDFRGKPYIQLQQLYSWAMENHSWEDWAPIVARYYATITQVDDAIGRVLAALDASGASGNTLVVFTADHGDMCGGHRMMDKHYVMYDDVVRVPFAVRWPGVVPAGVRRDEFVCHGLDISPTIMEAVGVAPRPSDGRSLLPLLMGGNVADWRQEVVSTYNGQQFGLYTQRMLRNGRWKYIWNTTDVDELYDLQEDPDELRNLAQDPVQEGNLAELRTKLYHHLRECGDILATDNNPWMRHQLLNSRKAPVVR